MPSCAAAAPLQVMAKSAVLLDAQNGEILYCKAPDEKRPPASTTKILTAILAIECGNLNQVVSVSENAANTGEASLHLRPGEKLTLYNLLHGALMKSANDACVAIAEAIAPSEEEFIGLLNMKAKALGAFNTEFFNTNGLPCKGHLTTAYDLAIITRHAMNNPVFADIVKKKTYLLEWEDSSRKTYIKNTNKLLWTYLYTTGVKTGTTDSAGKCLVASAKYGNRQLITVLLNSPDRFSEARRMLEYGFKEKGVYHVQRRY